MVSSPPRSAHGVVYQVYMEVLDIAGTRCNRRGDVVWAPTVRDPTKWDTALLTSYLVPCYHQVQHLEQ